MQPYLGVEAAADIARNSEFCEYYNTASPTTQKWEMYNALNEHCPSPNITTSDILELGGDCERKVDQMLSW